MKLTHTFTFSVIWLWLMLHSVPYLFGQSSDLAGIIMFENVPAQGASISIDSIQVGAIANEDGSFTLRDIPHGWHQLTVTYPGAENYTDKILVDSNLKNLIFSLSTVSKEMEEVLITGKTERKLLEENPIQISSIDVVKLQNESADIVRIIDRTAGVRVRQSGGLGSNITIQLNGLTGQAVRTYYNGMPLELFGGSIQLNNIPVNTVERIDVYKGVMPVDVGTDALAGGINVISRPVERDYLDASYQVGSFNTHVGAINAAKKIGKHLFLSLSSFYNYSDNNYEIRANQRTANFKEEEVQVERFHSAHQSSMAYVTIGLIDIKWADKFSYGISYNQRFDEIQHGVRIGNRAVGEADVERDALIHNINYQKGFDKLTLDYFGNFSIANEDIQDSTIYVYDWFGNIVGRNSQGMEVLGLPSLRKGTTTSHAHRVNLSYKIHPLHTIKVSSFFSNQTIEGNDPLAPRIGDVDPNTIPSYLTRSISGISYESKWFDTRLETILFGKYYYYTQSTADFRSTASSQIFEYKADGQELGYGSGLKYTIKEDFFVRMSYEQAIRIPTKDEVFGDFLTIEPNFFLKPEKSRNLNVGVNYKHSFSQYQFISLDGNWFLRDQSDLIRLEAGRNDNDPAQFINEEAADATGLELTLQAAPLRDLEFSFNLTLQDIVRDGERNATNINGIGNPIPNIPSTFYNVSSRYTFKNPLSKEDRITFFGYFTYVDEFNLIFQTTRNEENIIPTQRQIDLGLTYELADKGFTFSLQTNNILNAEVYDNFRIPKPGRNFSLKVRYLFQKL